MLWVPQVVQGALLELQSVFFPLTFCVVNSDHSVSNLISHAFSPPLRLHIYPTLVAVLEGGSKFIKYGSGLFTAPALITFIHDIESKVSTPVQWRRRW